MDAPSSERKALLFTAGGVRLALRLTWIREIVAAEPQASDLPWGGTWLPGLPVAIALGLPAGPTPFAVVTVDEPPVALRVERLHGIVDVAPAAVRPLPPRLHLPQPSPFSGVLLTEQGLALEVAVPALGWAPMEPAGELPGPPAEVAPSGERELVFTRGTRGFAVPVHALGQVLHAPRVHPVPLTPQAIRGLVDGGGDLLAVLDLPVLHGEPAGPGAALALRVEAGQGAVAVLADRILAPGAPWEGEPSRPAWETIFGDL